MGKAMLCKNVVKNNEMREKFMSKQIAKAMLFFVAVFWGGGFVATKIALDAGVSAGILVMLRGLIFAICVCICFFKNVMGMTKLELKAGLKVGIFNFIGFLFQAIGAMYTTPSNSSFLTTTSVVMVPFMVWVAYKVKPTIKNFISIGICLIGMGILTGIFGTAFVLNIGDVYTLVGAFFFGLSVVALAKQPEGGHFAASAVLMGVTLFIGGFGYFLVLEKAVIPTIHWGEAFLAIAYLSLISSFLCQTVQIIAQKHIPATTASLIMLLESVWGSVFSILWGFENFTTNLIFGGGLILISLLISELEMKNLLKINQKNRG